MTEATLFLPGLSPVGGKTITATFDGGKLSSNGGVLILREIEPKLSRLENAPFWRQLARMGLELIDLFCARFERVPRCIVLDIDDTDDAVHGQQQLALFNTHAGGYCFQPIQIFEATTGRPVLS